MSCNWFINFFCRSPTPSPSTPPTPARNEDNPLVLFLTLPSMSTDASLTTASFTPNIPTEVLLNILRFAAGDAVSPEYVPFSFSRSPTPACLSIKLAIILVCKHWRAVGAQFLYEDIRITPRRFHSLLEILDRTGEFESKPNGHYVRRLIFTTTRVDLDAAVLKCCPYVETLVKPGPSMSNYDGDAPIASFPFPDRMIATLGFVQRIDWSFYETPNQRFVDNSVSFFSHLVQITPGLRYLSLVSSNMIRRMNDALFSDLEPCFKRLRVLHLENVTWPKTKLPFLTHLVTSDPSLCATLHPLVVELAITTNAVDQVLRLCPDLQELSYDLTNSMPPARYIADNPLVALNITCVRLRVPEMKFWINEVMNRVNLHIASLSGPRFPSLRRCILHCDWPVPPALVKRTAAWEGALRARGCTLEWAA